MRDDMQVRKICSAVLLAVALWLAAGVMLHADEGMWTFDNPPLKLLKARYNFTPTQAADFVKQLKKDGRYQRDVY